MVEYPTVVSHLVMDLEAVRDEGGAHWEQGFSFRAESTIAIADYRALYDSVGREWHWVNRRRLDDKELAAIIHHPRTAIFVLRHKNQPLGFMEINLRDKPQAEIVFVGLVASHIGRGLGRAMLRESLCFLRALKVRRVIIQTCTLDHATALPLYEKMGFRVAHTQRTIIVDD